MSVFASRINTNSEEFAANRADMLALVDRLSELNGRGAKISEKRKDRFDARGQLTPRERLARLLDPGMPFLVIGNIAGYLLDTKKEEKSIPGATIIAGIGFISGVRCVVVVDDSGIQAGSLTTAGGYRLQRAQEISLEQKLPFVHLVESAGGDLLNYTVEGFLQGGRLFGNLAKLSKAGIPVIAILHGSSTAGGAYMPGLSDYVIAVKGRGRAFLAGPPLLKAATGEIATEEELGGAEMHATTSGLAEYLADDDGHAVQMARELISKLDWDKDMPITVTNDFTEPYYDPDEIAGLIPTDYRKPYDVRELAARIVDGSDFLDFKPDYGISTVCLQAKVFGHACAFIGNNGPIDPAGATKAAQFLQLCDQSNIPVVFLQNTTGYIVGTTSEQAGMIKHGSKMIQAVRNISVPRITFMVGASFGAGNYGMCGRGYDPDFLFTWPNAKTGVMGGDQAAKTMSMVARGRAKAKGEEVDEEVIKAQETMLTHVFDSQSDAFYTSGHLMDDGMIDPRDTRKTLGFILETVREAGTRKLRENSFGIARM
ncbi:acyl-CoA carboxylase subunit beta [Kordiimonas sp. SCSIO 12610]|uniref:acyl-CoA carboxylase subunit beta n=1 Tax=Kordiimonas sp. SCSIO 12610 TaxID=2829597 RepID=UPI00210963C9|nr:carboxyl transferase domain-containing protein [Kordiimonas sp. SCSIO 12610]UTW54763.1 acyl-CoA carboxylase subunit beta [Kordiimonas sp. SCSIO 12610]